MKVLITGANGQVAFELLQHTNNQATIFALTKEQLNITDAELVSQAVRSIRPEVVINTAAYTQVDNAEKNPEQTFAVNRDGAKNLAQACEKIKCPLIHLSTDYIFNGRKTHPYVETDAAAPLNIYGKSKWEGEEAIRAHCEKHVIIRVSAVFGAHGNNFVKTILRLAREKEMLRVINDQLTCPTPASDIAKMLWQVSVNPVWGTYHYAGDQAVSWYEFAKKISPHKPIEPIATIEYPTPAERPKYAVLDCEKIKKTYNIQQPDWQQGLTNVLKSYQPRKVLVTGGAGFIGANFIHYLLANDAQVNVINLDLLTYAGSLKNLENLPDRKRYTFIQGDITDHPLVEKILREHNIDTIVHFAAESHVDRSIQGPAPFIHTNVVGTFTLLEAARKSWLQQKKWNESQCRFHHISTDEVYGSLASHAAPFTEQSPYVPNSPYSASKASSDHLVRAYFHTYKLPVTLSHCSNNYGPYQHAEKLIPTIIHACLASRQIPIYGDGSNIRDWIYVTDHCRGVFEILKRGRVGEAYHLGGQYEVNNLAVARHICHLMDELYPKKSSHAELITFVTDRPGHDWRYAMNISKINKELAWFPQESFESGLQKTTDFYLAAL